MMGREERGKGKERKGKEGKERKGESICVRIRV